MLRLALAMSVLLGHLPIASFKFINAWQKSASAASGAGG